MKKPIFYAKPCITNYEFSEGESIETKVARITENNEPISDGAPIIYTNREDGVVAAYNIRTDKWDIAQAAMDAIHKTNAAKTNNYGKTTEETTHETGEQTEPA
uniref:Uncharacterized protein n=1 Tax=Dulem virus 224 TaxID=3145701 RepID=A0AAU8AYM4_9VIRU